MADLTNKQTDSKQYSSTLQKHLYRESLRENKAHGKKSFPFVMYHGRIPEWLGGYPLHWHNEFEIIFITYGEGIINVQGEKYFCTKDDIIIIPPQQIHSIVQDGQKKIAYYNILFDFSFLEENPDSFCSRSFFERFSENTILTTPHIKKDSELNVKLLPLINSLIEMYAGNYEDNALLIKARLFEIIYHLQNQIISVTKNSSYAKKHSRLKKVISFIQENFSRPISIEEAAELINLSPNRFMKMFKEQTGLPFIQYVNDYRLELAAESILQGTKSITQIAFECGFESTSYFINLFHKKFGLAPVAYRKSKLNTTH